MSYPPDTTPINRGAAAESLYVGDDDHASPSVDRGGYVEAPGGARIAMPGPGNGETPEHVEDGGDCWCGPEVVRVDGLNPKDAAALRDGKVPLDLLEGVANAAIALALKTGAEKYGRKNYRIIPIYASTYAAAIKRHADAFSDGEDYDRESGLSHLAHIGANLHVLLGAIDAEQYIEDRGPATRSEIQELQSARSNAQHSRTVTPRDLRTDAEAVRDVMGGIPEPAWDVL
jgi:hypothetical protein